MNMKTIAALLLASLLLAPVQAHEGHDHGDEAIQAPAQALPRFTVQGDELEVVGVLAADTLVLYVDHRADNRPLTNLAVEVEGQGWKGVAEPDGLGAYRLAAPALTQTGRHALSLSLGNDEFADLLLAELVLAEAPQPAPAATGLNPWLAGGGLLLAGLGLAAGVLRLRRNQGAQPGRTP